MQNKLNISKPTLVLDRLKTIRNIGRMADKARSSKVLFRPHFKTHQSKEIGKWFRDFGVNAITVSSVDMAYYFAEDGWDDITIAFPVNLREACRISALAAKIKVNILVDSQYTVIRLRETLVNPINVFIKIDVGYGRSGVYWDRFEEIIALAKLIRASSGMIFVGILTHNGHAYSAGSIDQIKAVYRESTSRLLSVKQALSGSGFDNLTVSTGDTPCCSVVDDFKDVDEIRPGNFIFFDLMQAAKGVCSFEDIAVTVACPVVGKHEKRGQIVIYGGAVHLSKESLMDPEGRVIFGCIEKSDSESGLIPDMQAPIISLSQEHGIVNIPPGRMSSISIGNIVNVYPVHSCLTCDLYGDYLTGGGVTISRL